MKVMLQGLTLSKPLNTPTICFRYQNILNYTEFVFLFLFMYIIMSRHSLEAWEMAISG